MYLLRRRACIGVGNLEQGAAREVDTGLKTPHSNSRNCKHREQRRKDASHTPFINHPIAVATILGESLLDAASPALLAAAYLHDTVEDTDVTLDMITGIFGAEIARLVAAVTDDKSLPWDVRKSLQIEHALEITDPAIAALKIADKIANLEDILTSPPVGWPDGRIAGYVEWSRQVVDAIKNPHPILLDRFHKAYERYWGRA